VFAFWVMLAVAVFSISETKTLPESIFSSLLFWQLLARCIEKLQENEMHSGFYTELL